MQTVCIVQTLLNLHNSDSLEGLTRSNFSHVTIECMYGQLFVYRQWSPAEIQTQTQWNLTGHGMLVPLPVISPRSILHPPLSHCAFVPTRKNLACVTKMLLFQFLCAILKKIVSVWNYTIQGSVCSSKGLWDIKEEDLTPLRHAQIVVPHILNLSAVWDLNVYLTQANYVSCWGTLFLLAVLSCLYLCQVTDKKYRIWIPCMMQS
jgi:hypothetical protein